MKRPSAKPFGVSVDFLCWSLIAAAPVLADDPVSWDQESVQKELDGMRRYTWVLADRIIAGMRQVDRNQYSSLHDFLDDAKNQLATIDPQKSPDQWSEIDTIKLISTSPTFWSAYYQIKPGDPLAMWFHACVYGINGHVHRARYAQALTLRASPNSPLQNELPRLYVSASRVIGLCQRPVNQGIKYHDASKIGDSLRMNRKPQLSIRFPPKND